MKTYLLFFYVCMVLVVNSSCTAKKKLYAAQGHIDQLTMENKALTNEVNSLKTQLSDLNTKSNAATSEYDSYKKNCEELKVKMAALQQTFNEEAEKLQKLEEMLETALADFQENGVDVYFKEGLVYVSLPDNLLYKSGSSSLNEGGKNALSKLATVLNQYPKLRVIVLGNTDSVQSKKGSDNLSLSTERANGVVRVLRDMYSVDPVRLTPAGKGQYNPVADNSTAEGRAKNRRTDIILNPDLERIWNSIKE